MSEINWAAFDFIIREIRNGATIESIEEAADAFTFSRAECIAMIAHVYECLSDGTPFCFAWPSTAPHPPAPPTRADLRQLAKDAYDSARACHDIGQTTDRPDVSNLAAATASIAGTLGRFIDLRA